MDGRQVTLKPDGTWVFVTPPAEPSAAAPKYTKSAAATKKVDAPYGQFAVWIDPNRWNELKREPGKILFQHTNGQAWALIFAEALGVPTGVLKEAALENARSADPNMHVVFEERRIVNGREVLCMKMEGNLKGLPFRYYGYYYGGASGSIQVVTYTLQSAFDQNEPDFTELLSGLEIKDQPLPEPPPAPAAPSGPKEITLNGGAVSVTYDAQKWQEPKTSADGKITLTHAKGAGFALIVAETLDLPLDALPDVALSNAKDADPGAQITFREKRKVGDTEVWCLKMSATISKSLPITYYGYYYGGAAGAVQVLTYTTPSKFAEYEADFTELLNSLRIKPKTP